MAATAASTAEVIAPWMMELKSAQPTGQVLCNIGDKPNNYQYYTIS